MCRGMRTRCDLCENWNKTQKVFFGEEIDVKMEGA